MEAAYKQCLETMLSKYADNDVKSILRLKPQQAIPLINDIFEKKPFLARDLQDVLDRLELQDKSSVKRFFERLKSVFLVKKGGKKHIKKTLKARRKTRRRTRRLRGGGGGEGKEGGKDPYQDAINEYFATLGTFRQLQGTPPMMTNEEVEAELREYFPTVEGVQGLTAIVATFNENMGRIIEPAAAAAAAGRAVMPGTSVESMNTWIFDYTHGLLLLTILFAIFSCYSNYRHWNALNRMGRQLRHAERERDTTRTQLGLVQKEIGAVNKDRGRYRIDMVRAEKERDSARSERDRALERVKDLEDRAISDQYHLRPKIVDAYAARDLALRERDAADVRTQSALAQRDSAIAERELAISRSDSAYAQLTAAHIDRDIAIAERDSLKLQLPPILINGKELKVIAPEGLICPICLKQEHDETHELLGHLICNHMIHKTCLERWYTISGKRECPTCKQKTGGTFFALTNVYDEIQRMAAALAVDTSGDDERGDDERGGDEKDDTSH
jgi:hypothetical protein